MFSKIPLHGGIYKDETPLKAKGYFVDGDGVRVVAGGMESILGEEKASETQFLGKCRGMWPWMDADGGKHAFIGTHLRAYAYNDTHIYDITPATSRASAVPLSLTTVNGSAVVTVTLAAHGATDLQKLTVSNASAAVGGITLSGDYVVSYTDVDHFDVTHGSVATSSAGPTAITVDLVAYLAPGNEYTVGGLGYGTGTYGTGTYGSPSNVTLYARTWTGGQWGENTVACPRGSGLFEFNPTGEAYTAAPAERVTNGTFTGSAAGWTLATNWAYAANAIAATAATSAQAASQSVTTETDAWHLLTYACTVTGGSFQVSYNGIAIGSVVTVTASITYVLFNAGIGGAKTLAFTPVANFTGTVDTVSLKQLNCMSIVPNAPTRIDSILVTDERMIMALGTTDAVLGQYKPLLVRWCDQDANTVWAATPENLAGDALLTHGGRIVRGVRVPGGPLIFTDAGTYRASFVPDPTIVYRFDLIENASGCAGPLSIISTDYGVFWISPGLEFYRYHDGGTIPLSPPLKRWFGDNLDWVQNESIHAWHNATKNEVGFGFAGQQDSGVEVSRSILFNYLENRWSIGTTTATYRIDRMLEPYALAAKADGFLMYAEKDFANPNGAPIVGFLQTADLDLGDGDVHMLCKGIIPDFDDLQGGLTIEVYVRDAPGDDGRLIVSFGVTASTTIKRFRARGRTMYLIFRWSSAPFFMRLGAVRLDLVGTPVRRTRVA